MVVIIIAVIAALSMFAMNGMTARAQRSEMTTDLRNIQQAMIAATSADSRRVVSIAGNGGFGNGGGSVPCAPKTAGTDLAALLASDTCWVAYASMLDRISIASGTDIRGIVGPWGRPYRIVESSGCTADNLTVWARPYNGWGAYPRISTTVPSNTAGC